MSKPKISVLIPLYNRRQYIRDCLNSVLNQTFGDFEILIRDDFSTDGVYEFVQQNFRDDRIKLFRNKKNFGEAQTTNLLAQDAIGKYFTILHNDDLYLPDALQNLYEIAEKFNADVVHTSKIFTFSDGKPLCKISIDRAQNRQVENISDKPQIRFNEWFTGGIFQDAQYNMFKRKFIIDSKIFSDICGWNPLLVSLIWIMKAKTLVKAPVAFYIRRENSDSQSSFQKMSADSFEQAISNRIELFGKLNKIINSFEFFRDNDVLKYQIKARIFSVYENLNFDRVNNYGRAELAQVYNSIERTFQKYFGDNAVYLALMYHWAHAMHFNQNQIQAKLKDCLKLLDRDI